MSFFRPNCSLIISLLICIALIGLTYFYYLNIKPTQVFSSNCLNQNADKNPQELVKNVIIEFEEAQILGDQRALSDCVSPSLDLSFLRTPTNRGLGCYTECVGPVYEIVYVQQSGSDEYIADVNEKRRFYSPGIGGGSYPEATVPVKFVLKKFNNQWLITSYNTKLSHSYGE
ncbi:hypothetical protein A3G55_02705 [Candidatus Giovannonibacteria bacterium RIFCSPLOWO2_12_FULL_44_25]|uniref:DUF4440 domain-containing protein n=4 Tax=Parcubacteria group TaxID=1794811 RepID=A0A837ILQ1_9BACT|nr:MAG: hypothetical protein UW15_C0014G0006 [Parcubacteria group bacterium GW2011_GWC1_44_10]KKT57062.1 MAG: hypothetical protein UW49_C0008G0024 [Candidatus Giovannonibacteria bacterium GW2011_GWB1_44_23]KKT59499.1 MAG: hypothetical protein UW53_C0011G0028 [Candidatus Giovannonibacteria bacterium GW2011_GWA1_44_25]KKU13034.1 MAG: hypothetical protein UX18_C0003G0002 [Candidatus Azambacteria bacterium GW2011_GWC2_45_7b]OGF49947.1 MAG: hypothetical protein A2120_04530 [Candidatus Giovannonibact